jgi:prolyl 4-hydroxylase
MSLSALPPEWAAWLRDGVARGCAPPELLDRLGAGGFARSVSRLALHEALCEREGVVPGPLPRVRPHPRTQPHRFQLDGHPVRVACVLDRPQVVVYDGLFSHAECDALLSLAGARLQRSTVVDAEHGGGRVDPQRTSTGASFQRAETPLLDRLERRISALVDWPVEKGEGFQVLRYAPGAEYRAHLDTFDPGRPGSAAHLRQGGQRVGTLVIFLAEPEAGGGTRFARAGLEVCPQRGAAVYFACVDDDGAIDPLSLHAGMPVIAGCKCVATKWLREESW